MYKDRECKKYADSFIEEIKLLKIQEYKKNKDRIDDDYLDPNSMENS